MRWARTARCASLVEPVEQALVVGEVEHPAAAASTRGPSTPRQGRRARGQQTWRRPELVGGDLPVIAQHTPPGPLEHLVEEQHRHVAADAVGVLGDLRRSASMSASRVSGLAVIELRDVGPRREVRIASARDDPVAGASECVRRGGKILFGGSHVPFRVLQDPGMIEPVWFGTKSTNSAARGGGARPVPGRAPRRRIPCGTARRCSVRGRDHHVLVGRRYGLTVSERRRQVSERS
jgi:hypothetical protein